MTDSSADGPSRSLSDWQRLDAAHYLHPFTDHAALSRQGTRVIVRAEGAYLYDIQGRQILDGMSGLWCVNLGYARRELAEAAYRQLLQLPYYNSFFQVTHPAAIELARRLAEVTGPQFSRVFFTSSGSEANDTAMRLVRRYWEIVGQPRRTAIISRKNAYHGSTIAAASLGGMALMHAQGGLPIPGITHIRQPYWFGEGREHTPEEFGRIAAAALRDEIQRIGPDHVAAFFAEPIQGAGGVIIPPHTYWPEIQRIIDEYGILLIADEVICGFGRTGRWFGSDYYQIRPDLMSMAKAITSGYVPLGAVMVGERVAAALINEGGEFHHGFTYSGHPAACAVACATIDILRSEQLVERVDQDLAPYLQARWRELGEHPLVGEARTLGLFGALELVKDKASGERFAPAGHAGTVCRDWCTEVGLVMRAARDTMIIAPPLIVCREQIDELVDKAGKALVLTLQQLHREGHL